MERKKIILILKNDIDHNIGTIDFMHQHFTNCSIDIVFLDYPIKKSEKRIGDHFKNLITTSKQYYDSSNKYRLAQSEPLSSGAFNLAIDYYDLLVTDESDYENVRKIVSTENLNNVFLPLLIIPITGQKFKDVVFLSTRSENTMVAFKKFCYLFPAICKDGDSLLLRFMDNSKDGLTVDEEKLLFEYLKTKCSNLSIHKVHGELQSADKKVINLSEKTLFVVDNPGFNLKKWIGTNKSTNSPYALFSLSA
ncbi:MAG: hypothetical protein CL840_17975 [Crocinitomicaceae bacterium]|nr:hypothetical protein [Crocinitomicaceae bacterium]|tara:strand:- start:19916 stop:20665 length:750 start_codon:yes stop_codon:yes gene_type:complete